MIKIPKDNRDKTWRHLEKKIQSDAQGKDKTFVLKGKWKKFVKIQDGFKIFTVNGTWIRTNLNAIFGHGGHGYVHEFIPLDEIWISTHHYHGNKWNRCGCNNIKKNQAVSKNYFDSCTIHEISEFNEMEKGKSYWIAHQIALNEEREVGLLPDPDTEIMI